MLKFGAIYIICTLLAIALLSACSNAVDEIDTFPNDPVDDSSSRAQVTAYVVDTNAVDFKGVVADTGTVNNRWQITGLNLPTPLTPPYILEFISTATPPVSTNSTGQSPITTLRTVLTPTLLTTGEQVYATPLTTMATDIAKISIPRPIPVTITVR